MHDAARACVRAVAAPYASPSSIGPGNADSGCTATRVASGAVAGPSAITALASRLAVDEGDA